MIGVFGVKSTTTAAESLLLGSATGSDVKGDSALTSGTASCQSLADLAIKMEVGILVCCFITFVVAQLVLAGIVFLNAVNDSFLFKGFQRSIQGYPVYLIKMVFNFRE